MLIKCKRRSCKEIGAPQNVFRGSPIFICTECTDFLAEAIGRLVMSVRENRAERLLTVNETAEILGLTPAAVRRRVGRGTLIARTVGRSLRFRREDLERAVKRR